jgi:glycosyltransferase involved in cell wall biosynthesis
MKVCFVTTNFPRHLDDSEGTFVWKAARAVAKHGHQVQVIAQHWPGLPTREWMENVEVIRPRYWWPESGEILRKEGGGLPIIWRKSWLARFQMIPFILVHTLAVARYARDCDVIHAQWTLSAGSAWLARFLHRRPILVTLHGSDIFQAAHMWPGSWLTCRVLRGCDHIIAVSQALAEATTQIGIPRASITVVPDGVDLTHFTSSSSDRQEPLILYVGSLIKRKGVVYLLEAMASIVRAYPSCRLVIVGGGPERPSLENVASNLDLNEQVTFAGSQTPDQVLNWMQRAKLFVLPSVEEGLGVVLLEALACGIPIVASHVGGIPEVVTPDVGVLVPPADANSLAEAIGQLLGDDHQWAQMSANARARAENHYDWHQIAAQFITIYERIAN